MLWIMIEIAFDKMQKIGFENIFSPGMEGLNLFPLMIGFPFGIRPFKAIFSIFRKSLVGQGMYHKTTQISLLILVLFF